MVSSAAADLHHVGAALASDQPQLVRLVGELLARLRLGDDAAPEGLAGLHDLHHALLEPGEVVGGEGLRHVEVVVEALAQRRADAELGAGKHVLHRLGEHVRGGVAHHPQAVLAVDHDGLDDIALGEAVVEIAQLAVHARHHDPAVVEQLARGGAGLQGPAFLDVAGAHDHGQVGHGTLHG